MGEFLAGKERSMRVSAPNIPGICMIHIQVRANAIWRLPLLTAK